jgi:glucose/mannose transport system permease protein
MITTRRFEVVILWILLVPFLFFILFPFWVGFVTALKDTQQIYNSLSFVLPRSPTTASFRYVLGLFRRPLGHSGYIAFVVSVVGISLGMVGGYCLRDQRSKWISFVFALVLFGIYIPPVTKLLPTIRIVQMIGLYNTNLGVGLAVGSMFLPMATILYRQAYMQFPESFFELARLEGANHLDVFFRIIVPLSKIPTVTVAILSLGTGWNVFLFPLVMTTGSLQRRPVGVALSMLRDAAVMDGTLNNLLAGAIISAIPPIIIYLIGQRYITSGFRSMGTGDK